MRAVFHGACPMRRDPRWPDCCNQPDTICPVMDAAICPFVNHKRRRDRLWAALPRCAECGCGEAASLHAAYNLYPEHGAPFHPFQPKESA